MPEIPEQTISRRARLGSPDGSFTQPGGPSMAKADPDAGGREVTTIRPMTPALRADPQHPGTHYGEADDAPMAQRAAEVYEPNTGSESYVTVHEHEGKARNEHQTVQGLDALRQAGAI